MFVPTSGHGAADADTAVAQAAIVTASARMILLILPPSIGRGSYTTRGPGVRTTVSIDARARSEGLQGIRRPRDLRRGSRRRRRVRDRPRVRRGVRGATDCDRTR